MISGILTTLFLILFVGLFAAQALTFGLVMTERGDAMRAMMIPYVAADVASSVAMLDRLPPAERADWLPTLARANYRLSLPIKAVTAVPAEAARPTEAVRPTEDLPPSRSASSKETAALAEPTVCVCDGTPV